MPPPLLASVLSVLTHGLNTNSCKFALLRALADHGRSGATEFITSTELRESDLRLVKDGKPLPLDRYTRPLPWTDSPTDGIVNADRVFAEYHAGATIILEALQRKWKPLTFFCRGLERFFHQGVQANAYLTPKNCQGFAAHYDTHDVFVLQIAGSKRWRIYRPVIELPLASQSSPEERELREQIGDPGFARSVSPRDPLGKTPSWSGSSGPFAASAWITPSFSMRRTFAGSCVPTSPTTTARVRIKRWRTTAPSHEQSSRLHTAGPRRSRGRRAPSPLPTRRLIAAGGGRAALARGARQRAGLSPRGSASRPRRSVAGCVLIPVGQSC
jgi:hypothetical protein